MKKKKKEWSPDKYIFAAFRKIWRWSPARRKALEKAAYEDRFICSSCEGRFDREEVAVDHKEPVISVSQGFEGWDVYYSRLFCSSEFLQVLCEQCHKDKTKRENKLRKQYKCPLKA